MNEFEFSSQQEFEEYKKELKKYYLTCLWMEGSKTIILLCIFGLLHLIPEFLISMLILLFLRTSGGGIHCKSYLGCLAVSLLIFMANVITPLYISLPFIMKFLSLIICAIVGYTLVPIVSSNRPTPSEALIRKCKIRTVLAILLIVFLMLIWSDSHYMDIGIWTIIIHILQLIIARIMKGGEK